MSLEQSFEKDPIMKDSLRERCREEYVRSRAAGASQPRLDTLNLEASTDDEYKAECSVIPKEHLNSPSDPRKKDELMPELENLPRFLESQFRPGDTFCLAALPFDDGFFGKESKEIDGSWGQFLDAKQFLKAVTKSKEDGLTYGIAAEAGYFYELLCDRLKKDVEDGGCSFVLSYPKPAGDGENKIWFLDKYQKALENLRAFLNEPLGVDKNSQLN